jgi:hypothetical protein
MQLVVDGEVYAISDRFRLTNGMKSQLAQRLTEVLQLRHAVLGGVDEYTVVCQP